MGREVRRVPKGWQHPTTNCNGREELQPMRDKDFVTAAAEWKAGFEAWKTAPESDCEYWEWVGNPPDREHYRPALTDEERTQLMMYEDATEGTPISPGFDTPEELAKWLADNNASAFGKETASYDSWLRVCQGGCVPSMVIDAKGIRSGVEAMADEF